MKKHLIKRKDLNYNIKDGWFCEVKTGGSPSGSRLKKNDLIYIAQSGYAVFGKGYATEVREITKTSTFEKFVYYALNESNVKDDKYWLSKIRSYSKLDNFKDTYILEYKIEQIEQFDICYPLDSRFLKTSVWYYLEDSFELKMPKNNLELTQHIPTKIREEVYHKYKINIKVHILDIDHLVPKSLGGPGNIIENLIPISASINRRKSNSVPSKLYDFGGKFGISIPKHIELRHDLFYSKAKELSIAKRIIQKINSQEITKVKEDYNSIKAFHFPSSVVSS